MDWEEGEEGEYRCVGLVGAGGGRGCWCCWGGRCGSWCGGREHRSCCGLAGNSSLCECELLGGLLLEICCFGFLAAVEVRDPFLEAVFADFEFDDGAVHVEGDVGSAGGGGGWGGVVDVDVEDVFAVEAADFGGCGTTD